MPERAGYDAIIAGARCAGATLALYLARAGRRVLLVEAGAMPSDQPMSTHFIQPFGMSILDELGIGDRVRALAPPISLLINGVEDAVARVQYPEGRAGSCLRRSDLDPILMNAAVEAGAEVRTQTRLVDAIWLDGRVVGAVVESGGVRERVDAGILVGADGPRSTVAERVGAEEYHGYDGPRAAYWAYFKRPDWYASDPRYLGAAWLVHTGTELYSVFPTNTDQLLICCALPREELGPWKGNHAQRYRERVRAHWVTAPLTREEPLGKVLGITKSRYFFRRAAGPGWALVGDAGLCKDPAPGLGITDAFRDAKALASAIVAGNDAARIRYWRERDVRSLELFEFARSLGAVGYNNLFNRLVFEKVSKDPVLQQRIVAIAERRVSPFEAFGTGQILCWVASAVLSGRFAVLKAFVRVAAHAGRVAVELGRRKRLVKRLGPLDSGERLQPALGAAPN
jgi:flavin-dependent dehydrogenase